MKLPSKLHSSIPNSLYPIAVIEDVHSYSLQSIYAPWSDWKAIPIAKLANLPYYKWLETHNSEDLSYRSFIDLLETHSDSVIAVYTTPTTGYTIEEFQIHYPEYFI